MFPASLEAGNINRKGAVSHENFFVLLLICFFLCVTACQAIPEQSVVVNKNKDLSEQIKAEETEAKHAQKVWKFEKEYRDNKK